jgi:hypothetical protein
MNYGQLFSNLAANPPTGWRVMHFVADERGGIYLWPKNKSTKTEPPQSGHAPRLGNYSILFEFHVTPKGNARILARARYFGKSDTRWLNWKRIADIQCGARMPGNQGSPVCTKSVALWHVSGIHFNSIPKKTAAAIRTFLASQPHSLSCFITHL